MMESLTQKCIMIREHHAVPYFGQSKEEIKEMHEMNREYVKVQE